MLLRPFLLLGAFGVMPEKISEEIAYKSLDFIHI
jgi:hypothetical protein